MLGDVPGKLWAALQRAPHLAKEPAHWGLPLPRLVA